MTFVAGFTDCVGKGIGRHVRVRRGGSARAVTETASRTNMKEPPAPDVGARERSSCTTLLR